MTDFKLGSRDKSIPKPRGGHGPWQPGQSGNPKGKPVGTRNPHLVALDQIGDAAAGDVLRAVVKAALDGDQMAARTLLDRIWPTRKGRAVPLPLPPIVDASDVPHALAAVVMHIAAGTVSAEEATPVVAIIEAVRRAIETCELAGRIEALETRSS